MKNEILKNELQHFHELIGEQQQLILSYSGKIPQLELDMLLDNIKKYYERIYELNRLNKNETTGEAVIAPDPVTILTPANFADVTGIGNHTGEPAENATTTIAEKHAVISEAHIQPENIIANIGEKVVVDKTPSAIVAAEDFPAHPETVSSNANVPENPPVQVPQTLAAERTREYVKPAQKVKSIGSLFDEVHTVAEKYTGEPTVFDKFGTGYVDKSIIEKHQKNPVTDLRKSIGINEKFSFINELFDGDLSGYNEAIDKLNGSTNLQQALDVLNNELSPKYQWTGDGTSFMQLKNLLDRRFSA